MKNVIVELDTDVEIALDDNDALKLFKWVLSVGPSETPYFNVRYPGCIGPWKIGKAYIPELFSTEDFWDNSKGREIADKWGIEEIGQIYYFTLEDYEKLKAELEENPYWKVWNENQRYYDCNIELDIVSASGELK